MKSRLRSTLSLMAVSVTCSGETFTVYCSQPQTGSKASIVNTDTKYRFQSLSQEFYVLAAGPFGSSACQLITLLQRCTALFHLPTSHPPIHSVTHRTKLPTPSIERPRIFDANTETACLKSFVQYQRSYATRSLLSTFFFGL